MAKTAPAPAADAAAEAPKGRKKLVVVVVPLLLVLVAAWYFVLGPGSGGSKAEEPKEPALGEVVALEPITMNLADGRLLKVGLALQLPLEKSGHGEVTGSVALDEAIAFLGEHTYAQLAQPAARQEAKQELSHRVAERYHEAVLGIYFTEFVMQ